MPVNDQNNGRNQSVRLRASIEQNIFSISIDRQKEIFISENLKSEKYKLDITTKR